MKKSLAYIMAFVSLVCSTPAMGRGGTPSRILSCDTRSIGLDTSQTNTYVGIYSGRSYGQTFSTADTLIESITIWRGAPDPIDNTPLRMFITEVDSTGQPDVFHIINSDVVVTIPPGDSVNATPGTWAYSPPLALPHRGIFCFAVHDDLYCLDAEPFSASSTNPYADGRAWKFTAAVYCENLGPPFAGQGGENVDMIFTINFCDTSTPVRRRTWGSIKTLYR